MVNKALSCIFFMLLLSCGGEAKQYEDYDEDDFIAAPGIITKVTRTPISKGIWHKTNVYYNYYLDSENLKQGKEMDISFVVKEGDSIIVFVHKDDNNISFFGSRHLSSPLPR